MLLRAIALCWLVCSVCPHARGADVFEDYLHLDYPAADGFDFPLGDPNARGCYLSSKKKFCGWYVSVGFGQKYSLGIHTGEDWNGKGGGNTDEGQTVFSVANGRVLYAQDAGEPWCKVVAIEHVFYENKKKKIIESVYVHLKDLKVKTGDVVTRRQEIGTIGACASYKSHLHLEMRWNTNLPITYWPSSEDKTLKWIKANYTKPTAFIKSHRKLFVPPKEKNLILVDQESYRMVLYRNGVRKAQYDIALGQRKGRKRRRGDLKTPKGMYFAVYHRKGDFPGPYGDYYGRHWIKINYPNAFDASWGQKRGLISKSRRLAISRLWRQRKLSDQKTTLGGGIGFHGWAEEWDGKLSRHLSWGCVVMHLKDIENFYRGVPLGTMVVIF